MSNKKRFENVPLPGSVPGDCLIATILAVLEPRPEWRMKGAEWELKLPQECKASEEEFRRIIEFLPRDLVVVPGERLWVRKAGTVKNPRIDWMIEGWISEESVN